jgi:hypothetical protein
MIELKKMEEIKGEMACFEVSFTIAKISKTRKN